MVILGLEEDFCGKFFHIRSYEDLSWFLKIKIERTENECRKIAREFEHEQKRHWKHH